MLREIVIILTFYYMNPSIREFLEMVNISPLQVTFFKPSPLQLRVCEAPMGFEGKMLDIGTADFIPLGNYLAIPFHRHEARGFGSNSKLYHKALDECRVVLFQNGHFVVHYLTDGHIEIPHGTWHAMIFDQICSVKILKPEGYPAAEWEPDAEALISASKK